MNDHTDGHVDNLARFVAPGVVACPMAFGEDDPERGDLRQGGRKRSRASPTRRGAGSRCLASRLPGRIKDDEHHVVPASHMNFLIANGAVILPTYEDDRLEIRRAGAQDACSRTGP